MKRRAQRRADDLGRHVCLVLSLFPSSHPLSALSILAEIQAQEDVARKIAEGERHAEELRRREQEEMKRMAEDAERERQAALEREQYMTMKEARLAAEKEVREMKNAHNTLVLLPPSSPLNPHTYTHIHITLHLLVVPIRLTPRYSFSTSAGQGSR